MANSKKRKSFWRKPEGVTGSIVLLALFSAGAYLVYTLGAGLIAAATTGVGMYISLAILGIVVFLGLDSKARKLIGYMFQSTMRWITGLFVQMNPIAILKNYVEDLRFNLKKMTKQMGRLRNQKHVLMEMVHKNKLQIQQNMKLASQAKAEKNQPQMILKSRKAGRLKESNVKYEDLLKQMEVMHRVLNKMRENSSILIEDIEDQVQLKEQERKAILASHNAMQSAMNIIRGDKDKKALFDEAMETLTEDVSSKVGEMERFMDVSEEFMKSVDLQNGVFEEKGLKMLEKWEAEADSLLLGDAKDDILSEVLEGETLDLEDKPAEKQISSKDPNDYENFFDE